MKNIVLSSVVMALLVFSGCADKEPEVDEKAKQEVVAQEVQAVKTETVSAENATVQESSMSSSSSNSSSSSSTAASSSSTSNLSSDSNEINMESLERDLTTVYFDFDKFSIRSDMQVNVTNSATVANGPANSFTVKLEGNCDEWGSDEYNFALGLKRASTVKKALIAEGVSSERITMVSYGESNPVCNDKTQDCWAQNRRVDFKLLP